MRSAFTAILAIAFLIPWVAHAELESLTDRELRAVHGQAISISLADQLAIEVNDLTEANLMLGPIPISGAARIVEQRLPRLTRFSRRVAITSANIISPPATLILGVGLSFTEYGPIFGPLLQGFTPIRISHSNL